jgi:hypothetical protein
MLKSPTHVARHRATGFGGPWLSRATACASGVRYIDARTLPRLPRIVLQLPSLILFLLVVPRARVRLSEAHSGDRIRTHLQLRRWGLPRFRLAQGVLHLPADFSTYTRGRRRQALRTNLSRARSRGARCTHTPLCIGPFGPAERWQAWNRAGAMVGEAWLTVDDECALLHSLVTSETDIRWLLHTAIVEQLCARGCRQLLTNSHDAFLMPAGQQYFQHLLGYSVERVIPRPIAINTQRPELPALALRKIREGGRRSSRAEHLAQGHLARGHSYASARQLRPARGPGR